MNAILMYIVSFGVLLGGADKLLGNRRGYGAKFEEGFQLLGPTALSMAGILCLANGIAAVLRLCAAPLLRAAGFDPSMIAGVLAVDMGGFQLAQMLAADPQMGSYAGIVVGATFGCTLVFTIPVGGRLVRGADLPFLARGIAYGLFTLPAALLVGGLLGGIRLSALLYQDLPVFFLAAVCGFGFRRYPQKLLRFFQRYVKVLEFLLTSGLMLGAVSQLTGRAVFSWLVPLPDAMAVVCSIGVFLLGGMPLSLLLQRLLKRPLNALGARLGLDPVSMTGLLVGCVSPLPALAMMKDMEDTGKTANAAFLVSSASAFGAHLAFTSSSAPGWVGPLLLSKLAGGAAAVAAVLIAEGRRKKSCRGQAAAPGRQ